MKIEEKDNKFTTLSEDLFDQYKNLHPMFLDKIEQTNYFKKRLYKLFDSAGIDVETNEKFLEIHKEYTKTCLSIMEEIEKIEKALPIHTLKLENNVKILPLFISWYFPMFLMNRNARYFQIFRDDEKSESDSMSVSKKHSAEYDILD